MDARSLFWKLINATLVVIVLVGVIGVSWMVRASNAVTPARTIVVTGEGKTKIAPDIAEISASVVSRGKDPKVLQTENTKKINQVIAYLKDQGVAAKDITTAGYNLYPQYRYDNNYNQREIDSYELNQTVTVTIRDLEKAGEIVGGLTGKGVNQINSFQFKVEDPEAQKMAAREEAFDNAKEKAKLMAEAAGVRIVRVVTFSEEGGYYPPIMYAKGAGAGVALQDAAAPVPTLEPGEQDVTVNVTVTYEIR